MHSILPDRACIFSKYSGKFLYRDTCLWVAVEHCGYLLVFIVSFTLPHPFAYYPGRIRTCPLVLSRKYRYFTTLEVIMEHTIPSTLIHHFIILSTLLGLFHMQLKVCSISFLFKDRRVLQKSYFIFVNCPLCPSGNRHSPTKWGYDDYLTELTLLTCAFFVWNS